MDVVNPLTGNLAQSTAVVQRQQSALKVDQVRREQALRKDVGAPGDHFEHQVESCEETNPAHDEQQQGRRNPPKPEDRTPGGEPDDENPGIDVTA